MLANASLSMWAFEILIILYCTMLILDYTILD